jgi:hypothetical protein
MDLNDKLVSVIRTLVPVVVGAILSWLLVHVGLNLSVDAAGMDAITVGIIAVYYSAVRLAEQKWTWLGWLLGVPKQPVYTPPTVVPGSFTVDPKDPPTVS